MPLPGAGHRAPVRPRLLRGCRAVFLVRAARLRHPPGAGVVAPDRMVIDLSADFRLKDPEAYGRATARPTRTRPSSAGRVRLTSAPGPLSGAPRSSPIPAAIRPPSCSRCSACSKPGRSIPPPGHRRLQVRRLGERARSRRPRSNSARSTRTSRRTRSGPTAPCRDHRRRARARSRSSQPAAVVPRDPRDAVREACPRQHGRHAAEILAEAYAGEPSCGSSARDGSRDGAGPAHEPLPDRRSASARGRRCSSRRSTTWSRRGG